MKQALLGMGALVFGVLCTFSAMHFKTNADRRLAQLREIQTWSLCSAAYEDGKQVVYNEAEAVGVGWYRSIKGQRVFKWVPPTEPCLIVSFGPDDNSEATRGGPYQPLELASGCPPPPLADPVVNGVVCSLGTEIGTVFPVKKDGVPLFLARPREDIPWEGPLIAWLEREEDAAYWLARHYRVAKAAKHDKSSSPRNAVKVTGNCRIVELKNNPTIKPLPPGGPQ